MGEMLLGLEGAIGNIDDTLVKIRRPFKDPSHSQWFNKRKKKCTIYIIMSSLTIRVSSFM